MNLCHRLFQAEMLVLQKTVEALIGIEKLLRF